jgi:hypothetical protein
VPLELALDHRYLGLVAMFVTPGEGGRAQRGVGPTEQSRHQRFDPAGEGNLGPEPQPVGGTLG